MLGCGPLANALADLVGICAKYWSEWQDLNLRPPRPERGALSSERWSTLGAARVLVLGGDHYRNARKFLSSVTPTVTPIDFFETEK
jgi:hypothetical protein